MKKDLSFEQPILWVCPKCGTGVKTRENQPRCRICGYRETAS